LGKPIPKKPLHGLIIDSADCAGLL
jgi:hypothetical protein